VTELDEDEDSEDEDELVRETRDFLAEEDKRRREREAGEARPRGANGRFARRPRTPV
jgi:hypothetical protein